MREQRGWERPGEEGQAPLTRQQHYATGTVQRPAHQGLPTLWKASLPVSDQGFALLRGGRAVRCAGTCWVLPSTPRSEGQVTWPKSKATGSAPSDCDATAFPLRHIVLNAPAWHHVADAPKPPFTLKD